MNQEVGVYFFNYKAYLKIKIRRDLRGKSSINNLKLNLSY